MKLTIVGCGTAVPEAERVCSGYWVEANDTRLLMDCGPGVTHRLARSRLPWSRLDHLLITHFHNDHIGDVPMLLFALKWGVAERRTAPLTIWAPHGIHERLKAMAAAFGGHVRDPGFPVAIREVRPGDRFEVGPFTAAAQSTPHTAESLCYRIGHEGQAIGYTGDTGPSAEVARFLEGCDVLVAECALPDDAAIPMHLTPSSLSVMAEEAAPGRLVVTHVYPQLDALDPLTLIRQAGYGGEMIRARDGLEIHASQRRDG